MSLLNSLRLAINKNSLNVLRLYTTYRPGIRPTPIRESKFLLKDNIPAGYQIIYKAPMENYLKAIKFTSSLTASIIGVVAALQYGPMAHQNSGFKEYDPIIFFGLVSNEIDVLYFAFAFVVLNIAVRVFISKYPLRIYRNGEKYIGVFDSQLPLKTNKINFLKGEVKVSKSIYLNPWKDQMYKLGKKDSLLLTDYFKTPSELTNMMK